MPGTKKINGLTDKQEKFCLSVAAGLDPSEAYRRAYDCVRMQSNTIARRAQELLKKIEISDRVKEIAAPAVEAAVKKVQVSRERITTEMAYRAFYDPIDLINVGSPQDIAKLSEPVRRSICGWGYDKFGNFTLKLADKDRSLRNLGETLAMFTMNNNNNNKDGADLSGVDEDTLERMLTEAGK